jgi:hypothetical protein
MKGAGVTLGLLLLSAGPVAAAELARLPAVLHVHSDLTTGEFSLEGLAAEAEAQGVGAILLAENYLLRIHYGLPPFRALTRVTRSHRAILDLGVEEYFRRVAEAQRRHPRVLLVPGFELIPHYRWSGSPLSLDLRLANTQKNLLVWGVADPAALRALPVTGNPWGGRYSLQSVLDALPVLLVGPGALALLRPRRRRRRIGPAVIVVRERRWGLGLALLAVGVTALVRGWPFTTDVFPPWEDFGLVPYQTVIDRVEGLGGVTVWSLPETRDSGEQHVGPVRVTWATEPHADDLFRTFRYTAFGAVYEDTTRFEQPGGGWDRLLIEYARGERSRPAWAVGESAFHDWSAGRRVGPLQTVFLATEPTERGVLGALRAGRMYALQRVAEAGLELRDFSVHAAGAAAVTGGRLRAPAGTEVEVRIAVDAVGGPRPVRVTLVRSGALSGAWTSTTPFTVIHRERADGRPAYFRLEARSSPGPHRLLSNPIFVTP